MTIRDQEVEILAADPPLSDYVFIYPAAGFSAPGGSAAASEQAAANNPYGRYSLENLKRIFAPDTATEAVDGIVRLATIAEARTGTNTTRAVTPAGVAAVVAAHEVSSGSSLTGLGTTASPLDVLRALPAYSGAGKFLAINDQNSASEWVDAPSELPAFTGAGKFLATNAMNTAAEWVSAPTGGAARFTQLADTPDSFSGRGGELLQVNSAGNAIEFITAPNSITTSERNKLAGIESGATGDQTGIEIVSLLTALATGSRLPYSALRNTPSIPTVETGATIVDKLVALSGNARLSYNTLRDRPAALLSVASNSTLTGSGTTASPLAVANPFTAADEAKLDAIEASATADQTGAEIVSLLSALATNARLPYSAIRNTPTIPSAETGSTIVSKLSALTGNNRLPITAISGYSPGDSNIQSDWTETDTTSHAYIQNKPTIPAAETGLTIRSKLTRLPSGSRLSYVVLDDRPTIPAAQVASDWNATTGVARILNKPQVITSAERNKLAGIETNATADQTGSEIVSLLSALTGNARLDASAIRNLPQPQGGGLSSVNTDSTLSGLGTSVSPLSVANPFTAADESKLDGIATGAEVNVQSDWNAASGDAFIRNKPTIPTAETGSTIVSKLEALASGSRLSYNRLDDRPTIPAAQVPANWNATTGVSRILNKPQVITSAERNKLQGIAAGAEVNVQADWNATTGDAFIRNKPSVITSAERSKLQGIAAGAEVNVQADWNASSGDAQILNKPAVITSAERSKLTGIEANATADQTGAEIVSLLNALTGNSRLPATAIRDLPQPEGGLTSINTDSTLSGLGTSASPLSVANPLNRQSLTTLLRAFPSLSAPVDADTLFGYRTTSNIGVEISLSVLASYIEGKLNIPAAETGRSIAIKLEALTGNARLSYSALEGTPDAPSFTGLTDTPATLGLGGQILAVNARGTALQFVRPPSIPAAETGATIVSKLRALTGNARLPATAIRDLPTGGGSTTFAGLTDTPSSLGTAGQIPVVNSAGDALEFINAAGRTERNITEYIYRRTATSSVPEIPTTTARWFFGTIPTSVENPLEGDSPTAAQLQAALDSNDVEEVTDRIQYLNNQNEVPDDVSTVDRIGFTWDGSRHADDHGSLNIFLATTASINAANIFRFGIVGYTSTTDFNVVTRTFGYNSFTLHKQITDADGVVWNVWGVTDDGLGASLNTIRMIFVNNNTFTRVAPHYTTFAAAARASDVFQNEGFIPSGWTGVPTGVTPLLPFEWVSGRRGRVNSWNNFSTPAIIERQTTTLRILTRGDRIIGTASAGVEIPDNGGVADNMRQGELYFIHASATSAPAAGNDGRSATFIAYIPRSNTGFNGGSSISYGTFPINGDVDGYIKFTALQDGNVNWQLFNSSTVYASVYRLDIE